ncbi:MAG: hypothetical protein ACT4QG_13800 [Sporichthyaceae bacterium]
MPIRSPRTRTLAAGAAVLILVGPWAATNGAQAARATKCTAAIGTIVLDPGLAATKRTKNTYRSPAAGTITCDGPVLGKKPTGPGVFTRNVGSFVGSCTDGGKGSFNNTFEFPTAGGTLTLVVKGPFTFGVLKGGAVGGQARGDKADGTFSVVPSKGDCVTSPVTEVKVASYELTLKR